MSIEAENQAAENENAQAASAENQTTPTETTAEVEKSWFEQRDFQTAEEADALIEKGRSLSQIEQELTAAREEVNTQLEIMRGSDNPHANETIAALNAIAKKTGIDDVITLSKIVSLTPDAASTNPLDSLVLSLRIKDPSLYEQLGGEEGTREMFIERYNIDDPKDFTPSKLMIADAHLANRELQNLREEVKNSQNSYTFAQSKFKEENEKFAGIQQTVVAQVNEIASTLTEIVEDMDGTQVTLKVSKEELDSVISQAPSLAGYFKNVAQKDVPATVKTLVTSLIKTAKLNSGSLYREWKESHLADLKQQATQEVYGKGSADAPNRTSSNTPQPKRNIIVEEAQRLGIKVPQEFLNGTF